MDSHEAPNALPRRDFVKLSGLGAAALAAGATGCAPGDEAVRPQERDDPQWWTKIAFELEEKTFAQLQEGMAARTWSAREITQLYLDRIALLDRNGPKLRSVIETNADALDIADGLDRERRAENVRGPLHGVPILVKDNIDTADGMVTAAGSLALDGHHAAQDSWVAERLRAAGAILLGKELADAKGDLSTAEYREALETARRLSRDEGIDALMEEHRLDAIVSPTTRMAWMTDLVNNGGASAGSSGPVAIAGYPSITVPNGYVPRLPLSLDLQNAL